MSVNFKIQGLEELRKTVKAIGKLPQKCVNRAVKSGAKYGLATLKSSLHFKNSKGNIKRALGLKAEKTKKRGKKAYQITYKKSFTTIFTTPKIKDVGKYGGDKRGRFYIPASLEFGRRGIGGKRPLRFMTKAADVNSDGIKKEIVDVLDKELKKVLNNP